MKTTSLKPKSRHGLAVLKERRLVPFKERNRAVWVCFCDCGKEFQILEQNILRNESISCGCDTPNKLSRAHTQHGHCTQAGRTKTYDAWASMINRCNPLNLNSEYHGKIGIKVCRKWLKFEGFLKDMGEAPAGFSIERNDNSKGYNKLNCRWILAGKQSWNRGCTIWIKLGKQRLPLNVAAKKLGVSFPFLKKWRARLGDAGAIKEAKRYRHTGKFTYSREQK